MSVTMALAVGLLMGAVFGVALEKSRVFEPGVIVGQMQLRSFVMLKVFLTAVVTGAIVLAALHAAGAITLHPKATIYGADIVGGLLLGAGITISGACPGTVMAQIGAGYRDAWATLAGGLVGALVFSYFEPVLNPILLTGGPGALRFDVLLGWPFALTAALFAATLVAAIIGLERWRPWRPELGPNLDGLTDEATARPVASASAPRPTPAE